MKHILCCIFTMMIGITIVIITMLATMIFGSVRTQSFIDKLKARNEQKKEGQNVTEK
jgi:hypothetical protein